MVAQEYGMKEQQALGGSGLSSVRIVPQPADLIRAAGCVAHQRM